VATADGQIENDWQVRNDGSLLGKGSDYSIKRQKKVTCWVSQVTRDITERKRTEEALQESEERLQAIWIIQLIYVNPRVNTF